jgi:hypothetical protein
MSEASGLFDRGGGGSGSGGGGGGDAALTHALQQLLVKHKKGCTAKKGPWRCATPVGMYDAAGTLTAIKLHMACSTDEKPVRLSAANYTGTIPQHALRCTICKPVRAWCLLGRTSACPPGCCTHTSPSLPSCPAAVGGHRRRER